MRIEFPGFGSMPGRRFRQERCCSYHQWQLRIGAAWNHKDIVCVLARLQSMKEVKLPDGEKVTFGRFS